MSNFRKPKYDEKTNKLGIQVRGKTHWFDSSKAYSTSKDGVYGVKIGSQNFFFPINDNFANGNINPYSARSDNKPSRVIPPIVFPRVRSDIGGWRDAMYEMEAKPWNWRVKTQTILQDTVLDSHVKACWTKRKRLTLLKKPCFYDSNGNVIENNPDLQFIYSDWWYKMLDFMLDAQGYGYQLIELGNMIDLKFPDIGVVPRQNISPDREVVAAVVYNVNGVTFNINPDDNIQVNGKQVKTSSTAPNGEYYYDWTIWVKTPNEFGSHTSSCGYGLFYWVALYGLLIRNNLQNNADFNEKFLQPIRWLKTDKTDQKERQKTFQQLVDAGSSLVFLSDPNDELTLLQNASIGTAFQSYSMFEERMKKAISALTLGHEDAMHSVGSKLGSSGGKEGGSGKSGHDDPIQQAISETESDQTRWLCAEVNSNWDKFRKMGFKIPYDIKYGYANDSEENEIQERQNKQNIDFTTAVVNLNQAGYDVDEKFIEEQTGIPVKKKVVPPPPKPFGKPNEDDAPDEDELKAVENFYKNLQQKYAKHAH